MFFGVRTLSLDLDFFASLLSRILKMESDISYFPIFYAVNHHKLLITIYFYNLVDFKCSILLYIISFSIIYVSRYHFHGFHDAYAMAQKTIERSRPRVGTQV